MHIYKINTNQFLKDSAHLLHMSHFYTYLLSLKYSIRDNINSIIQIRDKLILLYTCNY